MNELDSNQNTRSVEQAFHDKDYPLLEREIASYLQDHGELFSNIFVIRAKRALQNKAYREVAVNNLVARSFRNHPWGIYYQLLADIALKEKTNVQLINDLEQGIKAAIEALNVNALNLLLTLIDADLSTFTIEEIARYESFGDYQIFPFKLGAYKLSELHFAVFTLTAELIKDITFTSSDIISLSIKQKIIFYQIKFYATKYFKLIIQQQDSTSIQVHSRLVKIYTYISIAENYPLSEEHFKGILMFLRDVLMVKKFWHSDIAEATPAITPELDNWIKLHRNYIIQNAQLSGLFIGNGYRVAKFHTLKTLSETELYKLLKGVKRKSDRFLLIAYFHYWGGIEIFDLNESKLASDIQKK